MRKFFVRISYPDVATEGIPEIQTSFIMWDTSGWKAAERARNWGIAIVKDMLTHNRINPYIIDVVAYDLITVLSVKAME